VSRGEGHATHYWLWGPDGSLLSHTLEADTDALGRPELGASAGTRLRTGQLPDGSAVRMAELRFVPGFDDEFPHPRTPPMVTLVVAKQTESTQRAVTRIGTWFGALGLITLGAASFAAWWAVRRGLEPVGALGAAIREIDERDLGNRLDTSAVPIELRPIVQQANTLLDRLQRAFDKERRFTADVAHELRTPLSILRTEIELSLRRGRQPEEYRRTLRASLETVDDLAGMVENLLFLARSETEASDSEGSEVLLGALVREVWKQYAARAGDRALDFECAIDPARRVRTDPAKLRMIVANLLSNAAEYTERGGWVRVDQHEGALLRVVDSGPVVPAERRAQLFDRFWRADEARSEAGVHCGIGLSLVRSLASQIGCEVTAEDHEGTMAFVLRRRT
jgi:heavy metal sensor kinase